MADSERKKVVVVGLGMVGIAFVEKMLKLDARAREFHITVIGEEPHVAYNRVGLTSFFDHRKVENLYLNPLDWYEKNTDSLTYRLDTRVVSLDPASKTVTCQPNGGDDAEPAATFAVPYDVLVLATGSSALLPRHTPGHEARGVFVYRTVADLEALIAHAKTTAAAAKDDGDGDDNDTDKVVNVGAVVGGGLLGLEAAKAMVDLGTYDGVAVVERNRWVLSRQLDADAGGMVVQQVRDLGVDVMLGKRVGRIDVWPESDPRRGRAGSVRGVRFEDGSEMRCSAVCFAVGIRPRDELARAAGMRCAEVGGGGVVVGDDLAVDGFPDVYAVGECASWRGEQVFGLIAPGVEMADVLAFNLTQARLHEKRAFKRPDLSTKLKLLGVDVASFGDFFADRDGPKYLPPRAAAKQAAGAKGKATTTTPDGAKVKTLTDGLPPAPVKALTYKDPFQNVYKKYLFTMDGKHLLGGMMIGDTRDYIKLVPLVKGQKQLEVSPGELMLGAARKDGEEDGDDLTDDTQICSCHNVTKGDVAAAVKAGTCTSVGEVKACTKAGTGCGGCMPLVTSIFNATMKSMGQEVKNHLCGHFAYSRADLYNIVRVKGLKTYADVVREAGTDGENATGCEMCKPAVGSILASLYNAHVMGPARHGLQDTNDRWMGNIQRNGTFSVVPRVAAGEITPEKLIVIGETARAYGLYTKITGGQRIDMFGARKQDLLSIWTRLLDAGMESGHAYAKSLRTVKSCVGTTWCRFGVGDSVGLAVRLEERYKSIRAPHKIKGGVSGCVRECAEAQGKDFGLIATEKGFNIFVGGNGGARPRHAELLAADVPPADVVPVLDRFLMFYIATADKLQRTARWMESLPGGIAYLKDVVLNDSLGICAALEAQMQALVDSYFDEWAEAVKDPSMAERFRQFANSDEGVDAVELVEERDQRRPAYWPKGGADVDFKALGASWSETAWQPLVEARHFEGADDLPNGISATVKRGDTQLAVFRVRGRYYATQQMCPHKRAFVLSDGLIGQDARAAPKTDDDKPAAAAPWVSCPHHKRNFDLSSGACRTDAAFSIATFEAEERAGDETTAGVAYVYVRLPPVAELDAALGTARWRVTEADAGDGPEGRPFAELDKKIGFSGATRRARKGARPAQGLLPAQVNPKVVAVQAGGGGCGAAPDW